MSLKESFSQFVAYAQKLKGDEKGEAQIFLDHFFSALGYKNGLVDAGAELEFRLRDEKKKSTSFADLVWPKKVLIEMKKKGENLDTHLQQAASYWMKLAGNRPRYIILCNFEEFWIYDFDRSIYDPAEIIKTENLADRYAALNFLLPQPKAPLFGKNLKDVTAQAAEKVAAMFNNMVRRGIDRGDALKYAMQCVVSMFAEDAELLPERIFSQIIDELDKEESDAPTDKVEKSYDLIGELFSEMNRQGITEGGRYKGVDYFNGGLFKEVKKIELTQREIEYLSFASHHNWRHVNPAILGTLFETGLEKDERHVLGAHYTHEVDIKKIVDPVIVQPWMKKIEAAETLDEYYDLLWQLIEYKVLDPACGSGNFLFIAFRELKMIERKLLSLVRESSENDKGAGERLHKFLNDYPFVTTKQFFGLDIKPYAVELAKVTLMVAKELAYLENKEATDNKFQPLPLDNLDENIVCADALLDGDQPRQWPEVDAIIGNPPYQSKNKMQQEFGAEYLNTLRVAYPDVPGRADFCVYWFHKAHDHLKDGQYAGLVGTNTIRQNYSREGSLDYIVKNGGTIFNATSSEKWSGDAAVYVSIVSWRKGKVDDEKTLYIWEKDHYKALELESINSSLSAETDVSSAKVIKANKKPKKVFQGQTHGHEGFLVSTSDAKKTLKKHPEYAEVLKPFLIGDELVANQNSQPKRFVIDFTLHDVISATRFKEPFQRVELMVLPDRKAKGEKQKKENEDLLKKNSKAKVNKHHINFLNNWWKLSYGRDDMLRQRNALGRYIACARVTQRPIFEFISSEINPNDKVMAFCFEDYYSFGIIQSNIHWKWFLANCTTLAETPNYNTASIWDTFPWPQSSTEKQIEKVAEAAKELHQTRSKYLKDYNMTLRDLYRLLEKPGKNAIKDLHAALDKAVMEAYGFDPKKDLLQQLLDLNLEVAEKESKDETVQPPGLPDWVKKPERFITDDCVKFDYN
ncbi:DNA methyltransferase [Ekhidna sp.]|uniref:DNA methyltransferase n=1 Tax=Ekhidna sp. TaxID=2608089 RepID=UPI003B59DDE0